jgi:hypothetical protein
MSQNERFREIIPLIPEEVLMKYGEMTKVDIIKLYKSCFPTNLSGKDLKKLSRRSLMKLLANYHGVNIENFEFPEIAISENIVMKLLYDNFMVYMKNRKITERIKVTGNNITHMECDSDLIRRINSVCRIPQILQIISFNLIQDGEIRRIKFNDSVKMLNSNDNYIIKLIKSLFFDSFYNTSSLIFNVEEKYGKINPLCLTIEDGNTFYIIETNKMDSIKNLSTCKSITIVENKKSKSHFLDGNYFGFGRVFYDFAFFNGTVFHSIRTPQILYDIIYDNICKGIVDDITSFVSTKINALKCGNKYIELHHSFNNGNKSDNEKMEIYCEIAKIESNIIFPEKVCDDYSMLEFENAILHCEEIRNKVISETLKTKMENFAKDVNSLSPNSITIINKTAKFQCHGENSTKTEIALRAALIHHSTEKKIKTIFVKDIYNELNDNTYLDKLKILCSNIIIY